MNISLHINIKLAAKSATVIVAPSAQFILLLVAYNKRLFMIGTLRKLPSVFQGANYNPHMPNLSTYSFSCHYEFLV